MPLKYWSNRSWFGCTIWGSCCFILLIFKWKFTYWNPINIFGVHKAQGSNDTGNQFGIWGRHMGHCSCHTDKVETKLLHFAFFKGSVVVIGWLKLVLGELYYRLWRFCLWLELVGVIFFGHKPIEHWGVIAVVHLSLALWKLLFQDALLIYAVLQFLITSTNSATQTMR